MLQRLTVRAKLLLSFGVILASLLGVNLAAYQASRQNEDATTSVSHTLAVITTIDNARQALVNMQTGFRGFLLTGDDQYLVPYTTGYEEYAANLDELTDLTADNASQLERWDEITRLAAVWKTDITDPAIALRTNVDAGTASINDLTNTTNFNQDKQLFDQIRVIFTAAIAEEETLLEQRSARADMTNGRLELAIAGGTGLAFAVAIAAAVLMSRDIARGVGAVASAAQDIASGNRSRRINLDRRDEIGVAAGAFDQMADQLDTVMSELEASAVTAQVNEARTMALMESVGEGILTFDASAVVQTANPAAVALLGASGEQLIGRRLQSLLPGIVTRDGLVALGGGEVTTSNSDGDEQILQVTTTRAKVDGAAQYVAVVHDITGERVAARERERLYRVAERARSETRATLDAASDVMVLITPQQEVVTVNRRFQEMFGVSADEVLGQRISEMEDLVASVFGSTSRFAELILEAIADPTRQFTEYLHQRWPVERELELYSTPVHATTGEHIGRLYVFRDVTREREVDRMKTEFVSLVSHELRTPLTSIKGYVDLILDGEVGDVTPPQRRFLTIVESNASRLVALINDLLDISRIESGKVEINRSVLDLRAMITGVTTSIWPQIEGKEQHLRVALPEVLPGVLGDHDRVTQILTNLLSNAHKYTRAGGTITVSAELLGTMVRIDVQDTGVGMTSDELAQLFTKFYRARNRHTQQVGGTGLGLTITRSLVEMHGGEMFVSSTPDVGSTFSFTLPVRQDTGRLALPETNAPAGGRILVVEDEPDIAGLIRRYLERTGYTVSVAATAAEAVDMALQNLPDLITLDVMLPDGDGFAVLERLQSSPETRGIPVMLLSMMPDEGQGKRLGAVDYLVKPVQERTLIERIRRVLSGDNGRLVLIADDDIDSRQLIANHLRRAGFRVLEASDGREALEALQREVPDLVLLDVIMPVLGGVETLRQIRANAHTRAVPVVMLTASPGVADDSRVEIEQMGATLAFGKSVSPEELAATIAHGVARQDDRTPDR